MSPAKDELAAEIEAIRADIQNLTSTVGRIANEKLNTAQASAMESAIPSRLSRSPSALDSCSAS